LAVYLKLVGRLSKGSRAR